MAKVKDMVHRQNVCSLRKHARITLYQLVGLTEEECSMGDLRAADLLV
jgi:hypothetical protein